MYIIITLYAYTVVFSRAAASRRRTTYNQSLHSIHPTRICSNSNPRVVMYYNIIVVVVEQLATSGAAAAAVF